jgi:hypothetical protein
MKENKQENLFPMDELSEWRGKIINLTIMVDSTLNSLLLHYFPKSNRAEDFWKIVLHDESFTSSFKIKIINRLGLLDKYTGIKKDLQRIFEIRNKAAHSMPIGGSSSPIILINSRTSEIKSLEIMYNELLQLIPKVNSALEEVMIQIVKKEI